MLYITDLGQGHNLKFLISPLSAQPILAGCPPRKMTLKDEQQSSRARKMGPEFHLVSYPAELVPLILTLML